MSSEARSAEASTPSRQKNNKASSADKLACSEQTTNSSSSEHNSNKSKLVAGLLRKFAHLTSASNGYAKKPSAASTTSNNSNAVASSSSPASPKVNSNRHRIDVELQRMQEKLEGLIDKLDEVEGEPAESPDEECVLCSSNRACMLTQPCGHTATCRACFIRNIQDTINRKKLPLRCVLCRGKILRLQQRPPRNSPGLSDSNYSVASAASSVSSTSSCASVNSVRSVRSLNLEARESKSKMTRTASGTFERTTKPLVVVSVHVEQTPNTFASPKVARAPISANKARHSLSKSRGPHASSSSSSSSSDTGSANVAVVWHAVSALKSRKTTPLSPIRESRRESWCVDQVDCPSSQDEDEQDLLGRRRFRTTAASSRRSRRILNHVENKEQHHSAAARTDKDPNSNCLPSSATARQHPLDNRQRQPLPSYNKPQRASSVQ